MSLFDPQEECTVCGGRLDFRTPGCVCKDDAKSKPPVKPCPKCENESRVHLENRKMVFCGQCGFMEADGVPDFPCVACSTCGRVPKARTKFLHGGEVGEEGDPLEETHAVWTCCGATYPVDEKNMTFWCQIYLMTSFLTKKTDE